MCATLLQSQRSPEDIWLDAAYEALTEGGVEAVKIMPLAKRLGLTRTGFYWHFADRDALLEAMIQRWEATNTGQLVEMCRAEAGNICEALFNLMDCWLDPALFDARLDLAIRNWARTDLDLQRRLDDADWLRIEAVTDMFRRFGYSAQQAEVHGLTVIYTQIGYISMQVTEDFQERLARIPDYVALFAGTRPSAKDVAAFLERHRSHTS